MRESGKRWLWGITGLAAVLRFPALFANHFHADEALFASYARLIAVWQDPLLQMPAVDKPPLLFYAQAVFYPLFGPVEWAARLPDFIASLLLIPLVGVWAWRMYEDEKTAVFSSIFIALIPLTIQFSATAFTDPLLTLFVVAALAAVGGQQPAASGKSGVLFGLAAATKYQAWLFLPLLVGLGWLNGWRWREWRRWLSGLAPVLGGLWLWGWVRLSSGNLWSAQISNFGGLRLAWSWELWPRARDWFHLWGQAAGGMWLGGLLLGLLMLAGVYAWRRRDPQAMTTRFLLLFGWGYLLVHWLLAVPVWDRYLLPLLPILALVLGSFLSFLMPHSSLLIFLLLLPGAWEARNGRFPIGGYPGADQGAAVVAQSLNDAPYGTVLYDHWYSWQWRYHLFDKRVYVSWFPDAGALVDELIVFGGDGHPHYLALPKSAVAEPVKRAVRQAGFRLQPVLLAAPAQIDLFEVVDVGD